MRIDLRWGLPLLRKELIEQANRRRTYVTRFVYALVLFGACAAALYALLLEAGSDAGGLLGKGRDAFEFLLWAQIAGVYLLLPALVCGAITVEKERNTLTLLLLSAMRPWEILIQKLGSRLVVIFTIALLNAPLLGIAYALGGVSGEQLGLGTYTLGLTALQVGSVSIMCSAFCRTTAGAFMMTYMALTLLYVLPAAGMFAFRGAIGWLSTMAVGVNAWPLPTVEWAQSAVALLPMRGYVQRVTIGTGISLGEAFAGSWAVWLSVALLLLAGRWYLTTRALLPARNLLLSIFRQLDRFFGDINRVTGGIELVRSTAGNLPDDKPVAWLERTRRSIARPNYLLRLFMLTTVPAFVLCAMMFILFAGPSFELYSILIFLAWPVTVVWLAVHGAGTFTAERSGQTLEVLLTTPLLTRTILAEKVSAVWRFAMILALPLATMHLVEAWIKHRFGWGAGGGFDRQPADKVALYIGCSALSLLIYVSLVVWLSVLMGMWVRTQVRATIAVLALIAAICIAPFVAAAPVLLGAAFTGRFDDDLVFPLLLASPLMVLPSIEFNVSLPYQGRGWPPWAIFGLHFAGYGVLLLMVRWVCYGAADRLLGRVAPRRLLQGTGAAERRATPDSFHAAP